MQVSVDLDAILDDDDGPVPPLTRHPSLLDGLIICDHCGDKLVGVIDARGIGFYTHEEDLNP